MKKNFVLLILGILLVSCSSDDSNEPVNNDVSTGDYLPLTTGNMWTYNVQGGLQTGTDVLGITGDVNLSGTTYKKFQTEGPALGFYSSTLNNNGVRKEGDRLLITGAAMMSIIENFPLTINLNSFTMLDESAANGAVLGTVSGTVPYPYGGYTFNFNYTLTSTAMSHMATYTAPNGETYTDVKPVMIKVNLSVDTVLSGGGFNIPVTIMPAQDVVVSTRYFAKDIGAVYSTTDIHYELADFSSFGIQLPLPETMDTEQTETLIDYQVE